MIGTRTSSSYTPHVDVAPADRPLILVAPRWEEAKPFLSETLSPNEEIASVFVDAVLAAGGLPLQMSITEDIEVIRHYVDIADGIAIPGGPDVNPKRWGDDRPYDPTLCCEIRDSFEFKLVGEVLRAKKPLFTTCRGTQLLNVATGGTLCMDVPSLGAREGRTQWRHTHVLNDPVHPVEVVPGSLLERALGGHRLIQTNSAHHCCVDRLGKSTRLVAKATDGVPECIEVEGQPFCLGVQWHPEYTWKTLETDFNLWKSFVEAAAKVLRKTRNVRFVMAGSGDMLKHIVRRVAKLGIADRFHFTGFLKGDEVQRMFALSDVYVMPSVSEPFGISPLEAMRSNVPVIISKQSGVAEVLDYAIKVDYWDVDALADAIYGLVEYPALAEMATEKGLGEVTNLKWENAAGEVANVYRSLL